MTVSGTSTTTPTNNASSGSGSNSANDPSSVATQENQFLTSFLTELQNQDPTDPVSTTEFASQMAQYSMIEQQLTTNSDLSNISNLLGGGSSGTGAALSYLGTNVEMTSTNNQAPIQNGQVAWSYTIPSTAASVELTVTDANGDVVSSSAGNTTTGTYKYALSDTDSSDDGQSLYLSVVAKDSSGNTITPTVYSYATVEAIDSTSGTAELQAGNMSFTTSSVVKVTPASSTTNTSNTSNTSDTSSSS